MSEITSSQIIQWLAMGIGLIGIWFRNQFKIERLEEKHDEHVQRTDKKHEEFERQKDALWKWIETHEKEADNVREKFNREVSEIRGGILVQNEQFKQIMVMLVDFKDRLAEIKERLTRLENGR